MECSKIKLWDEKANFRWDEKANFRQLTTACFLSIHVAVCILGPGLEGCLTT